MDVSSLLFRFHFHALTLASSLAPGSTLGAALYSLEPSLLVPMLRHAISKLLAQVALSTWAIIDCSGLCGSLSLVSVTQLRDIVVPNSRSLTFQSLSKHSLTTLLHLNILPPKRRTDRKEENLIQPRRSISSGSAPLRPPLVPHTTQFRSLRLPP